jgi:hypothetical protein
MCENKNTLTFRFLTVQNVPRPGIFSTNSRWYGETVLPVFFCLSVEVPLTQHNRHSAHTFYVWYVFSNPAEPFCTHVGKKKKKSQIRVLPKLTA